jgi:CDP-paratose 2-epimerase
MHILVTGGAGFVGSNLCLALRVAFPEACVTALDNLYRQGSLLNLPRLESAGVHFHQGDVRDPSTFPAAPFDFMVECSAEPSVLAGLNGSPDYLFQTNLVGVYNCLEACRRYGAGIIFLSTSRVYPIARLEAHPWHEEETRFTWADEGTSGISSCGVAESIALDGARSLYGFTKLAGEQLIQEYQAAYGLKTIVNRCGVIAGPWQFGKVDQGVVSLWVMSHHFKRSLAYIGYGGAGKQVRDMLHIHDLCDLLVEQVRDFDFWDGWNGNVAGGLENSASLQEITALCEEITGNTLIIDAIPETRPNDIRIFLADCARFRAKLSSAELRSVGNCHSPHSAVRNSLFRSRSVRDILSDTHDWVRKNEAVLRLLA